MALKVQAIRKLGIKIGQNPEHLIQRHDELDDVLQNLPEKVLFKTWKKVDVEGKLRTKIIDQEVDGRTFRQDLKQQVKSFTNHVNRVTEQYVQVKILKGNLKEDEMMIQMDFAENFACRSLNEVQTAYWNQATVTLHPVVAYYSDDNVLQHQSFVVISDEVSHSSSTVCAFIDQLMPLLKMLKPGLKNIHYWTDSPSSQYRNRFIFYTIANHEALYKVGARWNYFETGHGMGPCDGLGGTVKRMADEAIRQGHALIQDATEFYKWGIGSSSMKGVKFLYVPKSVTQMKQSDMASIHAKPLKGTMKLHAVGKAKYDNTLITRETSCYCQVCLEGHYCDTWNPQPFIHLEDASDELVNQRMGISGDRSRTRYDVSDDTTAEEPSTSLDSGVDLNLTISDYVAAVYERNWYIGQIIELDHEHKEIEINFMEHSKNLYKWPKNRDCIWLSCSAIVCKVHSLLPTGKSERFFKISLEEETMIRERFACKKIK